MIVQGRVSSKSRPALASSRKLQRLALGKLPMCKPGALGTGLSSFSVAEARIAAAPLSPESALDRARRPGARELRPGVVSSTSFTMMPPALQGRATTQVRPSPVRRA